MHVYTQYSFAGQLTNKPSQRDTSIKKRVNHILEKIFLQSEWINCVQKVTFIIHLSYIQDVLHFLFKIAHEKSLSTDLPPYFSEVSGPAQRYFIIAGCEAYLSMYIAYISVSKPTPWAVAGPHGQLASSPILQNLQQILS